MYRLLLATISGLLVLSPAALAHVDNPEYEWWMSSDTGTVADHTMYQNDLSHPGVDVTIANGDSRTWEADFATSSDVDLGGLNTLTNQPQVWTLTLCLRQAGSFVAEIGAVETTGQFRSWQAQTVTQGIAGPVLVPAPVQTITVRNEHISFTPPAGSIVYKDERLGIRVTASDNTVIVCTEDVERPAGILETIERTHLHSTLPKPPYPPVPELPALLLVGAGIAGVALVARRR